MDIKQVADQVRAFAKANPVAAAAAIGVLVGLLVGAILL